MTITLRWMIWLAPLLAATILGTPGALADHFDALGMKGQRQVARCAVACTSQGGCSPGSCNALKVCDNGLNHGQPCEDSGDCSDYACNTGLDLGNACVTNNDCAGGCKGAQLNWYGPDGSLLASTGPLDLEQNEAIEVEYSGPEIFLWCERTSERDAGGFDDPVIILYDRDSGIVEAMSNDG